MTAAGKPHRPPSPAARAGPAMVLLAAVIAAAGGAASRAGAEDAISSFAADPTLDGKLHLTYRLLYQAQFFRFHDYRFNFPQDVGPDDRQAAEELEDRQRSSRDQDLDQYLAIRTRDLLSDLPGLRDLKAGGYFNGLDTEFSLRWFQDLDGTRAGNESLSTYDARGSQDLQLRTLNGRLLLLRKHLELTLGRQYIEAAEWVHIDGGRTLLRGLGFLGKPVELEAFGGRRVSYFDTISERNLYGGAIRYFPTRDTRVELSEVQYIDSTFRALLSHKFGPSAAVEIVYRQINEIPESVRLDALLSPAGWGLDARASYLGKIGKGADDFPFDYTFSDRVDRGDRDFDRRFQIGDLDPFDEVTLEAHQEVAAGFGIFAGATGHWIRDRGDRGVHNTDWYEAWGGVDTLHFPWDGLTGRLGVRFLWTDLPRRNPHPPDSPEFISDVVGDGEPSFAGVEMLLEQDLARRVALGTRLEFRNYSYDSRFADLSELSAVAVTAYARWRQNRFLSYTLSYTYERDYRFINPDFEDLHAVRVQAQLAW